MTVIDSIVSSANRNGVDPLLAIADAIHESGLNTKAVGDAGSSFGLFQLHRGGELGSLSTAQAFDPTINSNTALSVFKSTSEKNPGLTGGNLAAAAERPANQTAYASAVQSIYNSLKEIQRAHAEYDYNTIVNNFHKSNPNFAPVDTAVVASANAATAKDFASTPLGMLFSTLGIAGQAAPGTTFADGFGKFITNIFLPETWVRVLAFYIGIGLLIAGAIFIIMDYRKSGDK